MFINRELNINNPADRVDINKLVGSISLTPPQKIIKDVKLKSVEQPVEAKEDEEDEK